MPPNAEYRAQRDDQWVEDYFWKQWDLLNEETMIADYEASLNDSLKAP